MRIVFTVIGNSRRSNYLNGETLRYEGGGGSGTDTSSIVVAEYLASQGHEVVLVTEALEPKLEEIYKSLGRNYTPGMKVKIERLAMKMIPKERQAEIERHKQKDAPPK